MKSVVITGVSTGIGWGTAKVLLGHGFQVFGSVRRQADADRLQKEFGANFTPLLFDVSDEAAVHDAAREVRMALNGETLSGFVNNAGIAVSGPALELPVAEYRHQMEVNVIGPIIATQAFAPLLGADRSLQGTPGRIVMMSSVSGQNGNPMLSPYCTSKFALEGFSESIRREFMVYGIDVIVIGPGAVKTPIWSKAEDADMSGYKNSPLFPALEVMRNYARKFGESGFPVETIGGLVHEALTSARPRVRYAITTEPIQLAIGKLLPKRLVDRIIAKRLGLI